MNTFQNENSLDRLFRILLSVIAILAGYFWLGGMLQIIAYIVGGVMLLTGAIGFCGLYTLIGVNTNKMHPSNNKLMKYFLIVLISIILFGGAYASMFFSKKIFIEDFSTMNNVYKQTLYNTGQDNREESISNYEKLLIELPKFQTKYRNYKPYAIKSDEKFDSDISGVMETIKSVREEIYNGDLKALHLKLEGVKNVFQDILKRNNFSLLGVAMLDFHDAMEVIVAAGTSKDANGVLNAYTNADEKLKAVESMANDSEIQAIRTNLEALKTAAQNNQLENLPNLGTDLKSSFVKTYLKRG